MPRWKYADEEYRFPHMYSTDNTVIMYFYIGVYSRTNSIMIALIVLLYCILYGTVATVL